MSKLRQCIECREVYTTAEDQVCTDCREHAAETLEESIDGGWDSYDEPDYDDYKDDGIEL